MNIVNIHQGRDEAMGQNSCQPEGLRPQSQLTLSVGWRIFSICAAPPFASPTIPARNAHVLHYVRHSKERRLGLIQGVRSGAGHLAGQLRSPSSHFES